jgi:hypothetical protein
LGCFIGAQLAAWVLSGQALANLPAYLSSSFELARYHSEALASPGDPWKVFWALGIASMILALTAAVDWRSTPKSRRIAYLAMFSAAMFFQWKYGFVRPDHHTVGFFAFAMGVPFLVFAVFPARERQSSERVVVLRIGRSRSNPLPLPMFWRRWRLAVTAAVACLAAPAIMVPKGQTQDSYTMLMNYLRRSAASAEKLLFPLRAKEAYDAQRSAYAHVSILHRIQERVGSASVDLLYSEQGWLFYHRLHWQPRPVFQGYICYSPLLLEANAAFYRSEKAPDYVLLHWLQIDQHFLTLEENQMLFEILRRYEPVLLEGGWALLKRLQDPAPDRADSENRLLREQSIGLDEWVEIGDIPDRYQTLSVQIRPTWWGRLRTFFFKPPPVHIRFRTNSKEVKNRLVPSMAEREFLLNPFVQNVRELLALYADAVPTRVTAFQITVDEYGPASYANDIQIRLKSRPHLIGHPISRSRLEELLRVGVNDE